MNTDAYFEAKGVTQKPEKQERETLFHFGVVKSLVPDICFERGLLAFPRECPKGVAKSFALRLSLLSLPSNRREREIESRLSHFGREEESLGMRLAKYRTSP